MSDVDDGISAAIISAIVALVVTGATLFTNFWFARADRKKAASYLAVRVVCVFDKYVEDCLSVVQDDGLFYGQRDESGGLSPQVSTPGAPIFPDDVDWKSIDINLMYEILSFSADVDAAERDIAFTYDVIASGPDYEEFFETRAWHYAELGIRIYALAKKLRLEYRIPAKEYGGSNPVNILKEELEKIKSVRSDRQKREDEFKASPA